MEAPDDFGGDDANAGEENIVGRELKGESALANMEQGALSEKKFLESKDKLFKMVESGTMSHDQFINIINELSLSEYDVNNPKPRDWRNDGSALRSGGMGPTTAIGTDGSRYASRTPGVAQVKAKIASDAVSAQVKARLAKQVKQGRN